MKLVSKWFVGAFLIGSTFPVSAELSDSDALLRRLTELEDEQKKSQQMIKELRSEIKTLNSDVTKVKEERLDAPLYVGSKSKKRPAPKSTFKPLNRSAFPQLEKESRFIIQSHDTEFNLGIDGTLIGRYEMNHRKDDGLGSGDTDQGFEMTGTRINFQGKLYSDYGYWVRVNADEHGDPSIDAAIGYYNFNEDTILVLGQFPSVLNREQFLPVDKVQTQESSPTNYTFDPFGYKGVMLAYHTPRVVYRGIINDGYRSINNGPFEEASAQWAIAGQVSGMLIGGKSDWSRFDNFTSRPGDNFIWMVSGALHTQKGASHGADNAGNPVDSSDDMSLGMIESSMEGDGWNFYVSGYSRRTDLGLTTVNDYGLVFQGGLWVAKHFELYSRYDVTIPDSDRLVEDDKFRTFTTGINFYPLPHTDNIKIGAELLYMFDAEADSIVQPNEFSSVRASSSGDQFVFRTQALMQW
ncbi:MAG: hypothetical protein AB9Q23_11700 [Candidatus Reddybacter sp.]